MKTNRGLGGIAAKLVLLGVLPTLAVAIISLIFSTVSLKSGMETEALRGLEMLALAVGGGYTGRLYIGCGRKSLEGGAKPYDSDGKS